MNGKYRWFPPIGWGVLITILSLIPGGAGNLPLFGIPYADKIGHFGMYAIWAFLFSRSFTARPGSTPTGSFWKAFILCTLIGILLEFGQDFLRSGRSYEIADMLANGLGALAGSIFGFIIRKKLG